MFTDDKFFAAICTLALLTTVGAFLWVHQGSIAVAMDSRSTVAEVSKAPPVEVEPQPLRREDTRGDLALAPTREGDANFHVTASVVSESAPTPSFAYSTEIEGLQGILESIANGTEVAVPGYDLPELSDVLVRRDRDGRMVVAPGTHRRYDQLAESLAAIEATDAFALISEGLLDGYFAEAVLSLLAMEAPQVEPDMVARGSHWGFADNDYEALGPAEKHLLLMGRENATTVRAKLMELRELIGEPEDAVPLVPTGAKPTDVLIAAVADKGDTKGTVSIP